MLYLHNVDRQLILNANTHDFYFYNACRCYCDEYYLPSRAFWHFKLSQLEDSKNSVTIMRI